LTITTLIIPLRGQTKIQPCDWISLKLVGTSELLTAIHYEMRQVNQTVFGG
jgi:hypothetical protein